jgi:hypothetical protein
VLRAARDETIEDEIGENTQNEGHEKDRPPAPVEGQPKDQKQKRRENEKDHGRDRPPLHHTSVDPGVRVSVRSALV